MGILVSVTAPCSSLFRAVPKACAIVTALVGAAGGPGRFLLPSLPGAMKDRGRRQDYWHSLWSLLCSGRAELRGYATGTKLLSVARACSASGAWLETWLLLARTALTMPAIRFFLSASVRRDQAALTSITSIDPWS